MKFTTKEIAIAAIFTALMALGAFMSRIIPQAAVPFSFQPFFCALCGIIIGSRLSLAAQLAYIALGLIGIPVFTKGGGLFYILEPTFGFILGFVVGAYVIGLMCEKLGKLTFTNALFASLTGLIIIYLIGTPYMYMIMNLYLHKGMDFYKIIAIVVTPFILKDAITFVIAAVIAPRISAALKKARLV